MHRWHFENCKALLPKGEKRDVKPNKINREGLVCPHCLTKGYSVVMYRFHFDNCKMKPN